MKAKSAQQLPEGADWLYELKLDGYRFLATKGGKHVHLWSRTENDFTARFPQVADAIRALPCASAMLDGELIVTDEQGRPSFQLIQNANEHSAVQAVLFDLVQIDGEDLRAHPLSDRRARLAPLVQARAPLHFSAEVTGDPESILAAIRQQGMEGIIAKRRDSRYEPGLRSGQWLKVKCQLEQEFVIGGMTEPRGARSHFGALLTGYYDGAKKLCFSGRVGTGFDAKTLRTLHAALLKLRQPSCPFSDLPRPLSRWGQGMTRAEMSRCIWTKPQLVCQVRFTEWTSEGLLRQPAFLGLREDKRPRDVVRET